MNRLVSRTDALGNSDKRTWDTNDNLVQYIDRRGQTSTYAYDNQNRLTTEIYPDATVTRTYDFLGRLAQINDSASGVFTYQQDLAGRLLESTTPFGSVQYTYDNRGLTASRQVTGQPALAYTYDPDANLAGASMPQASATFSYDARNFLSTISRGNGVTTSNTYDLARQLLSIDHAKGDTLIDTESYGYDAVGNRNSHATSFGQPLTTAATTNTFNAANQLTQFGSTNNSFDPNGNLAQESTSATYAWNGRNRLKSIATASGQTTTFTYDPTGMLLQQSDRGPTLNLTKTFILDDLTNVAFETSTDGSSYSVIAGRSIDSHMAIIDGAGAVQYGLSDAINSTIASIDQNGAVRSTFRYEPFGQTTATGDYPFQFTGRQAISNTLNYNRARFYNAVTGRFISEDPISLNESNQYGYALNSPILKSDPSGLDPTVGDIRKFMGFCDTLTENCQVQCVAKCQGHDESCFGNCAAWCRDVGLDKCVLDRKFPAIPDCALINPRCTSDKDQRDYCPVLAPR
jgi:RHS repeat-associated protein